MSVLYLDVTSSCKSPLNTGVQRVVRGIYRELQSHFEVIPLIWSPGHSSYCHLSSRELGYLEHPFTETQASAAPERQARGPFWKQWWRHHQRRERRVNLQSLEGPRPVLFVPEIFQDNRIPYFQQLPPTVQIAAVFYDAITLNHPELSGHKRQEFFETYLKSLAGFHLILPISRESEEDLESYWRQQLLPRPPNRMEYLPGEFQEAREFHDPDFFARRILVVSTLERRKNHLAFLEACELLWQAGCQFEVELIGRSAKEGGDEVTQRVEELQNKRRPLLWLRHVDDAQLEAAYQRCSFTVYPSLIEGFGMPILESLWHRRPCICGSNGALGEVALGGGCLAVDQKEPQELAQAMRQLLENESLFQNKVLEATQRQYRSWKDYGAALAGHLRPLFEPTSPSKRRPPDSVN